MLLRHTFIYAVTRGLPGVASFLAIYAYTRLLTPEEYGSYSLIFAYVTLANSLLFEWNRRGVLRYLPNMSGDTRVSFLSAVKKGSVVVSLLTLVASPIIFLWVPPSRENLILLGIGLVTLWTNVWFEMDLTMLRSQLKPRVYGMAFSLKTFLSIIIGILLAIIGLGSTGLLIGMVAGFAIPSMLLYRRVWGGIAWLKGTKSHTVMMLKYGIPITITSSLGFIIFYSGRFFLSIYHDLAEAGIYSVAYDLTQKSLILIMTVINLAGFPLMIGKVGKVLGGREVEQLKQNVTLMLFLSVPATVGMAVLSGNLSEVLLGAEYRTTATVVIPWVTIAAFLQGLKAYYFDTSFQIKQKTLLQLIPVLLSLAVNITFNIVLIPPFGALGASVSAILSYFVSLISSWIIGQRIYPLPFPLKETFKILVSSGIMSLAIFPVIQERGALWLVLQCLIGGGAYLITAYIMNIANIRSFGTRAYQRLSRKKRLLGKAESSAGGID